MLSNGKLWCKIHGINIAFDENWINVDEMIYRNLCFQTAGVTKKINNLSFTQLYKLDKKLVNK